MEIRFDDELTCRFALEVGWSTATHVSMVSQRSSECQTLLQNRHYLRIEERYKTSNLAVAREDIYLLFYEFSEFFDEKQLFNAGSKITKIADRNGRHIGCPNGARGWSDLPTTTVNTVISSETNFNAGWLQ